MELRDARNSDAAGIRRVARESLGTSYESVVDDADLDQLVETDYADEHIESLVSDPDVTVVVAADDDVLGFAQGHLVAGDPVVGDVDWLHVHPDERGQGVGVQLLGEVVDRLDDENAALVRGRVIEANEGGGEFYEAHGFEQRGTDSVEIAGEDYDEDVYERHLDEDAADAVVESATGPDGEDLYVDYTGSQRGTEAPFYPVFSDQSLTERWGWRCSNCESMDTTMDSSGRISCANCSNERAATRWDASYL